MQAESEEYVNQMDAANKMMRDFTEKKLPESVVPGREKSSQRVRQFLTKQRDTKSKSWAHASAYRLEDAYPTLRVLSPALRQVCALHLAHSFLETVPYLSSRYLSPQEQAVVAEGSVTLEFSRAEAFSAHPDLGRGLLIFRQGIVTASRLVGRDFTWHSGLVDKPIDVNEVLVEDEFAKEHHLVYHSVGFARAFFVPRSVILTALENNEAAWKECARWRYFLGALVLSSEKSKKKYHECL